MIQSGSALVIAMTNQLRAARLYGGVTLELKFHSTRRWRFDFAWLDRMVALEVEGGTWKKSRHTSGLGYTNDCIKYSEAALLGWRVIRVTGNMVHDGRALGLIERALTCPAKPAAR